MGGTRPRAGEPRLPEAPDWADKVSRVSQSRRLSRLALHLFCVALPKGSPGRWRWRKPGAGWVGASA